jgi:hypothetical protein
VLILEHDKKTRRLAILLGTQADAKIFLKNNELIEKQQQKKSPLKEN